MRRLVLRTLLLAVLFCGIATASAHASGLTWSEAGILSSSDHVEALSCPSTTSCTALVYRGTATAEYTFSPTVPSHDSSEQVDTTGYTGQLACPSTSLCVFGDIQGTITTFDPADPEDQNTWQASDAQIQALACPSATECVEVDTQGGVQSFNPGDLGSALSSGQVRAGANWLSCPAVNQCTVVGSDGAETFDPTNPPQTASSTGASVDGGTALLGVSCPSTSECVAIDYDANAIEFNPQAISAGTPQPTGAAEAGSVGEPGQPLSIDCDSTTDCYVVSDSGDAYNGDPATGTWTDEPVLDSGLAALSCTSATMCVSLDLDTRVYLGTVIPPGGFGAGLGKVDSIATRAKGFALRLQCIGSVTDRCSFTLKLASGSGRGQTATETVVVKPGFRKVTIGVSAASARVLSAHRRLPVTLTVAQRRIGATVVVLRHGATLH